MTKPSVTIIGPGSLGSAIAVALRAAKYSVGEIVAGRSRDSQQKARRLARKIGALSTTLRNARVESGLIWLSVPDRAIADVAGELASRTNWKGKIVIHSSGALSSDELKVLKRRGAAVASLHPLMTFVPGSKPPLAGVPWAVEGDTSAVRIARRVVKDLKGEIFKIPKRKKAAYHAWGAFASPLLLAVLVAAEDAAELAGVARRTARRRMLPIVLQTVANYRTLGPEGAFSGPIIRGDVDTVSRHLKALRRDPGAREMYLALARAAMRNLPVRNRKELTRILGG
jgi:predicted short-subunit dehydrogenase-like oxidoreductase (DUF2520 family)